MVEGRRDSLEVPEGNVLHSNNISKSYAESPASPSDRRAPHRRAFIGSPNKSDSATKSRQNVPHYLRASTGSCHDFCKYGRKDSSEEKSRVAIWKRNDKPMPDKLNLMQVMISGELKKEKIENKRHQIDKKASPDTKTYSRKPKRTSFDKAHVVKDKPSADAESHSRDLLSCGSKSYPGRCRTSLDANLSSSTRQSISHLSKNKPSSAKTSSPDPPEVIKSIVFPNDEVPVKDDSSTALITKTLVKRTTSLSKQKSSSLKLNLVKVKPSFSSENSDGKSGRERRPCKAGTVWNITASKASAKIVLSPRLNNASRLRKDDNLTLSSPLKIQPRLHRMKINIISSDEKVSEKTLHTIEAETKKNVSEPIPNEHVIASFLSEEPSSFPSDEEDNAGVEHSDSKADEFISETDESPEIGSTTPVGENCDKILKKSRVVVSESKHCSPVKLKFKAGKVVDLKSDYHSPRRLKFRRARITGSEDSKVSLGRALKKGAVYGNAPADVTSSEKIVLKHQDVQDKKDAQGLFNNVIEETASKLVETRKSKVKALVGAFETVISLQESKPT